MPLDMNREINIQTVYYIMFYKQPLDINPNVLLLLNV